MNIFTYKGVTREYNGSTLFLIERGISQNKYRLVASENNHETAITMYESMMLEPKQKKRLTMVRNGEKILLNRFIKSGL